jgi:hypothetical protein
LLRRGAKTPDLVTVVALLGVIFRSGVASGAFPTSACAVPDPPPPEPLVHIDVAAFFTAAFESGVASEAAFVVASAATSFAAAVATVSFATAAASFTTAAATASLVAVGTL